MSSLRYGYTAPQASGGSSLDARMRAYSQALTALEQENPTFATARRRQDQIAGELARTFYNEQWVRDQMEPIKQRVMTEGTDQYGTGTAPGIDPRTTKNNQPGELFTWDTAESYAREIIQQRQDVLEKDLLETGKVVQGEINNARQAGRLGGPAGELTPVRLPGGDPAHPENQPIIGFGKADGSVEFLPPEILKQTLGAGPQTPGSRGSPESLNEQWLQHVYETAQNDQKHQQAMELAGVNNAQADKNNQRAIDVQKLANDASNIRTQADLSIQADRNAIAAGELTDHEANRNLERWKTEIDSADKRLDLYIHGLSGADLIQFNTWSKQAEMDDNVRNRIADDVKQRVHEISSQDIADLNSRTNQRDTDVGAARDVAVAAANITTEFMKHYTPVTANWQEGLQRGLVALHAGRYAEFLQSQTIPADFLQQMTGIPEATYRRMIGVGPEGPARAPMETQNWRELPPLPDYAKESAAGKGPPAPYVTPDLLAAATNVHIPQLDKPAESTDTGTESSPSQTSEPVSPLLQQGEPTAENPASGLTVDEALNQMLPSIGPGGGGLAGVPMSGGYQAPGGLQDIQVPPLVHLIDPILNDMTPEEIGGAALAQALVYEGGYKPEDAFREGFPDQQQYPWLLPGDGYQDLEQYMPSPDQQQPDFSQPDLTPPPDFSSPQYDYGNALDYSSLADYTPAYSWAPPPPDYSTPPVDLYPADSYPGYQDQPNPGDVWQMDVPDQQSWYDPYADWNA